MKFERNHPQLSKKPVKMMALSNVNEPYSVRTTF